MEKETPSFSIAYLPVGVEIVDGVCKFLHEKIIISSFIDESEWKY